MKKQKTILTESIELDEKQTPSDRIFHIVGLCSGFFSAGLLILDLIFFYTAPEISAYAWMLSFYPILIFAVAGLYCSSAQLLRNPYFSSILAFCLSVAAAVAAMTVLIVQAAVYNQVFIVPFIWF